MSTALIIAAYAAVGLVAARITFLIVRHDQEDREVMPFLMLVAWPLWLGLGAVIAPIAGL